MIDTNIELASNPLTGVLAIITLPRVHLMINDETGGTEKWVYKIFRSMKISIEIISDNKFCIDSKLLVSFDENVYFC